MATIAPSNQLTMAFPRAQVVAVLTKELLDVAGNEADLRGIKLPKNPAQAVKAQVPMDSLTVVDAILVVEPIIGFPLHDSTVRTGGYNSVEEALGHLVTRIEQAWLRKNGRQKIGADDKKQN